MTNLNIVFDLDDTLINSEKILLNGAYETLENAKKLGATLYLLSFNEYAEIIARQLGIAKFFTKMFGKCNISQNHSYCQEKSILFKEIFEKEITKDCILFDDLERNINDFIKSGGKAYLVKNLEINLAWKTFLGDYYLNEKKLQNNQKVQFLSSLNKEKSQLISKKKFPVREWLNKYNL